MEFKPKNRDWVKNAAIAFLAVLLVLTFFSNTIMNRTLPEVATQYVESGPITAKVRGTGTVTANGAHQVKAEETREIRAVMVKTGQEVQAGDVLFVLGQGESSELEQAQEQLRTLQLSYQKAAIGMPTYDYTIERKRIERLDAALKEAEEIRDEAEKNLISSDNSTLIEQAKKNRDIAKKALDDLIEKAALAETKAQEDVNAKWNNYQEVLKGELPIVSPEPTPTPLPDTEEVEKPDGTGKDNQEGNASNTSENNSEAQTASDASLNNEKTIKASSDIPPTVPVTTETPEAKAAREDFEKAKQNLKDIQNSNKSSIAFAQANYDRCKEIFENLQNQGGPEYKAYKAAQTAVDEASDALLAANKELELKIASDQKNSQMASIDLSDIGYQIEQQKKKIKELSGGEGNEITAKVGGTIQTVDCAPGDTKLKDDILCTIEVPDMGYNLSFSVTNDQARRLRPGDSATVSNYYWGNSITATLSTIKVDPKNPQTNKLLTFDLDGDVNTGAELTLSVGQKSANYDVIIPNSSIRNDTNGSFVLKIEAKNSALGNRYIARRVGVEVLAADDVNSAVSGDLSYGDYVITTSNAPVKTGDQVRMADS